MLRLLTRLPKDVTVAISGGVDSVAVTDFLSNNHNVNCAFFHHGTENSDNALSFLEKFCDDRGLYLIIGRIEGLRPKETSIEEFWRNERYRFLESVQGPVVTAHNLDDCVETYLFSSLHGTAKTIPYRRNNVIRPFLLTSKKEFVNWCVRKNVDWCEDTSNNDVKYMRNYIRHELMPHALVVNPGLTKVVAKKVKEAFLTESYY